MDYWIQRTIPQVYDDSLSFQELLAKVIAKLNEVVEEVNNYFDEDIVVHVGNILSEWYDNGKLATIINNDVFNMKVSKDEIRYITDNMKNPGLSSEDREYTR